MLHEEYHQVLKLQLSSHKKHGDRKLQHLSPYVGQYTCLYFWVRAVGGVVILQPSSFQQYYTGESGHISC